MMSPNDLSYLTIAELAPLLQERKLSPVELMLACLERGKYVGICGQGPSDHPDLAEWLVAQGIESMSLNPDTVVDTWLHLAETPRAT